jgi:PadR family transcriptional regulator, regulatory protein AphA
VWVLGLRLGLLCCGGSSEDKSFFGKEDGPSGPFSFCGVTDFYVTDDIALLSLVDIYLLDMLGKKTGKRIESRNGTATPDALLGLLSMAPMSGYGMRSVISQSIGHFWSESFGQIYPALKRLTVEGFVEKKTERQKGRPDRHMYSLTEAGRDRIERWLMIPAVAEVPRNELLLKLFFGSHAPVSASRESVEDFVAAQEAALKVYSGITKELKRERSGDLQLPFWLMTVSYGTHYSTALAKWGRETLKQLDAIERAGGKKTARSRATQSKR